MARSLDIPARYVEGFLVSGAVPDEEGFIHVRNSMGHAWGEVYLEGYGWHRFEPTPPESVIVQTPADNEEPEEPQATPPATTVSERQPTPPREAPTLPQLSDSQSSLAQENIILNYVWLIPIAVVMFLVLLLALRVMWVYQRERRARKLNNREAVCYYFSTLLKYLKFFHFEREKTETVFQFYKRVARDIRLPDGLLFPREIVEIYAKAYYGNTDMSLEERAQMEREASRIGKVIQVRKGKWKYFLYKYVLAVI